ncbi:MAG: galactokinase, partial [Bacteroidia bacterium]|nr:galactokinase [Bacteroidia bacterium]
MNSSIIAGCFRNLFGQSPLLFRSPGRINLIGEHTDYNEGFVLPAAIDKAIILAVAANNLPRCRVYAYDYEEAAEFSFTSLQHSEKGWANYIIGVLDQLRQRGYELKGFDCVFGGDIPIGAGLSSSAALECGIGHALSYLWELALPKIEIVKLARQAENEFVGVKCGIMDQFANTFGKAGHVIKLDCRSLDYSYYPCNPEGYQVVLLDTQVKHSLASSEYNTRRQECEKGVMVLNRHFPAVKSLRDCSEEMLEQVRGNLEPIVYQRCRYVIQEIARVEAATHYLEAHQWPAFGAKMYETHQGLKEDYEVSCPELDLLVDLAQSSGHVLGARMM